MRPLKTRRIEQAEQLVQWMVCVPKLSPTSPRFRYYADNWDVLSKIRRFVESGGFSSITKDCPAFSAEELRAALDYLDQHNQTETDAEATSRPAARQLESA